MLAGEFLWMRIEGKTVEMRESRGEHTEIANGVRGDMYVATHPSQMLRGRLLLRSLTVRSPQTESRQPRTQQ